MTEWKRSIVGNGYGRFFVTDTCQGGCGFAAENEYGETHEEVQ